MKRILSLFFVLASLAAGAQEKTSTFSWSTPGTLSPAFAAPDENERSGDFVGSVKFTAGDVTFEVDDSGVTEQSRRARFHFNYTTRQVELRVYMDSYVTITAAEGRSISSIVLEGPQSDRYYLDMISPTEGVTYTPKPPMYERTEWTVPAGTTEVRFYADQRTQLTLTTVTTTDAAGVADIVADSPVAVPEWYTLQGVRLPRRPTAPGIYLERRAGLTGRILVR